MMLFFLLKYLFICTARLLILLDGRKTKIYTYYYFLEVQEITIRVIIKRSFVLHMQYTCTLYLNSLMKIKNGKLDSCVIKLSHRIYRVKKCTALTIIKH